MGTPRPLRHAPPVVGSARCRELPGFEVPKHDDLREQGVDLTISYRPRSRRSNFPPGNDMREPPHDASAHSRTSRGAIGGNVALETCTSLVSNGQDQPRGAGSGAGLIRCHTTSQVDGPGEFRARMLVCRRLFTAKRLPKRRHLISAQAAVAASDNMVARSHLPSHRKTATRAVQQLLLLKWRLPRLL
jgi:hypothetical protein